MNWGPQRKGSHILLALADKLWLVRRKASVGSSWYILNRKRRNIDPELIVSYGQFVNFGLEIASVHMMT